MKATTLLTKTLVLAVFHNRVDFQMMMTDLVTNVILFKTLEGICTSLHLTSKTLPCFIFFTRTSLKHVKTAEKEGSGTLLGFGLRVLDISDEALSSGCLDFAEFTSMWRSVLGLSSSRAILNVEVNRDASVDTSPSSVLDSLRNGTPD